MIRVLLILAALLTAAPSGTSGTSALAFYRLQAGFPRFDFSVEELHPVYIYTINPCVWCDRLKLTMDDARVGTVLASSGWKVVYIEGPVKGIKSYPHIVAGNKEHSGYMSPTDFLKWFKTVKPEDKNHD